MGSITQASLFSSRNTSRGVIPLTPKYSKSAVKEAVNALGGVHTMAGKPSLAFSPFVQCSGRNEEGIGHGSAQKAALHCGDAYSNC